MASFSLSWSIRVRKHLIFAVLIFLFGCAKPGRAAVPLEMPALRIEGDMHTNAITSISADASGALALTTSNDKSARVWDLSNGRLLRVLRPALGDFEGALSEGEIAPDGKTAAIAGFTTISKRASKK